MKKLSLLILATLSAFIGHAQNPWISLYDQSVFDLPGKTAMDTICIPVRLEDGLSLTDVQPSEHPSFVRLTGQSRQVYIDAMRIGKGEGPMPVLRLIVNTDLLTESGAYQAIFSFTAPKHSRLDISLTLNRVAMKLDTVHRIAIHIDGTDIRYDPFMVRESGCPFDIKSLFISPPYMRGIKDKDFIQFHPQPGPIPAGSVFAIPYDLSNEYAGHTCKIPLGTSTGWVEISVPGLSNTLNIPIDIINKRSKWWIVLATFLGILMGALVRNVIRGRLAAAQTRTNGFDLILRIKAETSKITDKPFKDEIDALITELRNVLLNPSAQQADLDSALKTATDKYNTKKTTFETTLSTTGDDLKVLTACLGNARFSAFLNAQLAPVREEATKARDSLQQQFDPTTAAAMIRSAITAANKLISHYNINSGELLTQLTGDPFYPVPLLSIDSVTSNKTAAQNIVKAVQAVKADSADTKSAAAAIDQLDKAQSSLEDLLDHILSSGTTAFNAVYRSGSQDPKMAALGDAFDAWHDRMEQLIRDPYQTMTLTLVQNLNSSLTAISAQPLAQPRSTRGQSAIPVASRAVPSPIARIVSGFFAPPIDIRVPASGMVTIDQLASQSRKRLLWLNIIQITALSVVLSLIFYKTYGPNFIGTLDEMINLFLLGFSLDVTIDGVTKLIGKP